MKSTFSGGVSGSVLNRWIDQKEETALFQNNKISHLFFVQLRDYFHHVIH